MALRLTPLLLAVVHPAAISAQPAALVNATDRVFAAWNSTHTPGCAVGVSRGGTTLLERGYGMADLAGQRPITAGTILESGSVAKQFTATAVMLLLADGKLALRDRDQGGKEVTVTRDALVTRIRDLQGARPDRAVVVAGDKAARYEEILKVMDTLQGNGITRIGLLVQTGQTAKPAR